MKYTPAVLASLAGMALAKVPFDSEEVVCTGNSIDPNDYGIVQGAMDRWLAGSNVEALTTGAYIAEEPNAQLAVCNYGNNVGGDAAEIDHFNFLVDRKCGAYRSGYVWISAWQKTYWRESHDGLVCENMPLGYNGQGRTHIACPDDQSQQCSPYGWKSSAFKPINHKKRERLAKRQPFPQDYQTGCTGHSLNPGHYTSSQNCMYQWFTNRFGVAPGNAAFRCDYQDTVLAMCNYGGKTGYDFSHDPDEIDQFNGIMDAKCGHYQSGWVYIPDWDKTYWRDTHDTQICMNVGFLSSFGPTSVLCSTDDGWECVPNKINGGAALGGQDPPDIWNE